VTSVEPRTIAILGGAGALGSGLAKRFTHAGHKVLVGSREPARVAPVAYAEVLPHREAASRGDIIFLTVPFAGQAGSIVHL